MDLDVNIKKENVCRTCLTDDGHFFNITDIFDHYSLTQMIQNITNLQMNPLDGYTQSICLKCVEELRRANTFRIKCLESNDTLMKLNIKTVEVPVSVCGAELPKVDNIKKEVEDSCDVPGSYLEPEIDCKSETREIESDCDYEDSESKEQEDEDTEKKSKKYPLSIFDCPLCHALFSQNNIYKKHIYEFHPDNLKNECFNQQREIFGYILNNSSNKKWYKCALDEFIGNSFVEFRNHMKEHTGEKPVVCEECGFRTTEIALLKKHRVLKHIEEKKFFCSLCDYSCQRNGQLKSHFISHTSEKNYKCDLCEMTFKSPSTVYRHKKTKHEKIKSYVCDICQKAYFRNAELKLHLLSHTGEQPHICHHCGKAFSRAVNMKTHVARKHDPTTALLKCDRCDYSTKNKSELKQHIMRHNGEKPFKCPQCPFSCVLSYNLKVHIMRHSGKKNFSCDLCDYKGVTKNEVKGHRKIHTGEKPFHCTICDSYSSSTRGKLKVHMQTHSTELQFECPKCPYKTNVRKLLTRHVNKNLCHTKRGRRPSKLKNIPSHILMNVEDDEDTKESIDVLSNNVM